MIIDLNPEALNQINSEIINSNTTLTSSYYPNMRSALQTLNSNIQTYSLNRLLNASINVIDETSTTISKNVDSLSQFLANQIKIYNETIAQLYSDVSKSVTAMQQLADEISSASSQAVATSVKTTRLISVSSFISGV